MSDAHDHPGLQHHVPLPGRATRAVAIHQLLVSKTSSVPTRCARPSTAHAGGRLRTVRGLWRGRGGIRRSRHGSWTTRGRPSSNSAIGCRAMRSWRLSRTPTGATTWWSAHSAPATPPACSGNRRIGTRVSRTDSVPWSNLGCHARVPACTSTRCRGSGRGQYRRHALPRLPRRPGGTEGMPEAELAELVTRDSMIGVGEARSPV